MRIYTKSRKLIVSLLIRSSLLRSWLHFFKISQWRLCSSRKLRLVLSLSLSQKDGRETPASGLIYFYGDISERASAGAAGKRLSCGGSVCRTSSQGFGTLPLALHTWTASEAAGGNSPALGRISQRESAPPPRFTLRLHYTIPNKPEYCILRSRSSPSLQRFLKRPGALERKNEVYGMSGKIRIDPLANGSWRGLLPFRGENTMMYAKKRAERISLALYV